MFFILRLSSAILFITIGVARRLRTRASLKARKWFAIILLPLLLIGNALLFGMYGVTWRTLISALSTLPGIVSAVMLLMGLWKK
jgi:hypothetical protein